MAPTSVITHNCEHLEVNKYATVSIPRTLQERIERLIEKKPGDFTDEVIVDAYKALVKNYYPRNLVVMSVLHYEMQYAGPREAIMHAIMRKNFGCTKIAIGRDHAGVWGLLRADFLQRQRPGAGRRRLSQGPGVREEEARGEDNGRQGSRREGTEGAPHRGHWAHNPEALRSRIRGRRKRRRPRHS
ncbi:MAG: hypothetical protein JRN73_07980 [Nitrososphaerota archaeon]|nr:hypothetical protein [Nitrososphaerota archaeon]